MQYFLILVILYSYSKYLTLALALFYNSILFCDYNRWGGRRDGTIADACAKRWKAIRNEFVMKLKKKKSCSGEGPPFNSNWPLFDMLLFLSDSVRHRVYIL